MKIITSNFNTTIMILLQIVLYVPGHKPLHSARLPVG